MNQPESDTVGGLSPTALSSLFQAINGLRNRRALLAMLGCMVVGVLLAGLFSLMASRMGFFMGFLAALSLFIAGAIGINAAGVLLMDQARGLPSRTLIDAVVYGALCIPKFILLGLALFAVALAVFIALALVYVFCKIPVLGPILFVVVFPLSVVISGLTLWGLFLCMFLALPAIWEGATITRAVAQALAIARSRLVESLLLMAVVGLLSMVVGFIVFGVLFTGLMPSIGMSAGILGGDGLGSMLDMMRSHGELGGGISGGDGSGGSGAGGYGIAAGIGAGLLWALAGSLVSLVYLLGLNLVYLRVTEGLDVGATEAALRARLDEARRQAADLGQKAKEAAERARDQARQAAAQASAAAAAGKSAAPPPPADAAAPTEPPAPPAAAPTDDTAAPPAAPPAPPPPASAKTASCPQCHAPVGSADIFCGVCGYRLK